MIVAAVPVEELGDDILDGRAALLFLVVAGVAPFGGDAEPP
jgi:hypothetical protein